MTTGISVAAEDTKTAPRTVPEGRPGDFAFLTGEWRIHNRFRENGTWIEFPGEATVVAILGGDCQYRGIADSRAQFLRHGPAPARY